MSPPEVDKENSRRLNKNNESRYRDDDDDDKRRRRRSNSREYYHRRSRSPSRRHYDDYRRSSYDRQERHRDDRYRHDDRSRQEFHEDRREWRDGDRRRHDRRPDDRPHKRLPEYRVIATAKDEQLGDVQDDPRGEDPTQRITKKASSRGNGRNTESFDPASTLVRPDLRIHVGSNKSPVFDKPLKHDDVVIIPELFGPQDDWTMYYQLVKELREIQAKGDSKGSEWISWHEGAHLICKNPTESPTFKQIIDRLCEYFHIRKESIGTRFNWYRDRYVRGLFILDFINHLELRPILILFSTSPPSSDWKPFHHDSAAFNPQRARNQNITVGVSFGATRELAFIRAEPLQNDEKVRIYFPQTNNGVFSFGRDANILWKHGVNALPPDQQDGKGRISIILWGLAQDVIEEEESPPLLGSDGQGPHANNNQNHNKRPNNRRGSRGGEKSRRMSSPNRDKQDGRD